MVESAVQIAATATTAVADAAGTDDGARRRGGVSRRAGGGGGRAARRRVARVRGLVRDETREGARELREPSGSVLEDTMRRFRRFRRRAEEELGAERGGGAR